MKEARGTARTVGRQASHRTRGIAYALAAAVMFGASTPFVRPVLAHTDTAASAGYLYLGQALGLKLISPAE